MIKLLDSYRLRSVSVVLNRVRGDMEYDGTSAGVDDVREMLSAPVIGAIPDDDGINMLSTLSLPQSRKSEGYIATLMLTKMLRYGTGTVYDAGRRYRGIFGGIRRKMRKIV